MVVQAVQVSSACECRAPSPVPVLLTTAVQCVRRILGKGIVTSEGALWRSQRAVLSPAFHQTCLENMIPVFLSASQRLSYVPVLETAVHGRRLPALVCIGG